MSGYDKIWYNIKLNKTRKACVANNPAMLD